MNRIEFKEFTVIHSDQSKFTLSGIPKDTPILWCNQGMYRVIPVEIVKEVIRLSKDYAKQPGIVKPPELAIHWAMGRHLDPDIGKILSQANS